MEDPALVGLEYLLSIYDTKEERALEKEVDALYHKRTKLKRWQREITKCKLCDKYMKRSLVYHHLKKVHQTKASHVSKYLKK